MTTSYTVQSLPYGKYNIIRVILTLSRQWWCLEDILDAIESEDALYIVDGFEQVSKLYKKNNCVFELVGDTPIELDDAYSYYFDGGNKLGYIPECGLTLITEEQVIALLQVDGDKVRDFANWFAIRTGRKSIDDILNMRDANLVDEVYAKGYKSSVDIICLDTGERFKSLTDVKAWLDSNDISLSAGAIKNRIKKGIPICNYKFVFVNDMNKFLEKAEKKL